MRLNFVGPFANGFLLTINDSSASYAIIRYNIRTYRSAGVVAVIGGKDQAELELKKFEDAQDSSDRHEGWRYLIDRQISRRELIPLKLRCIARRNWKSENQKLCGTPNPRTFRRSIVRDKPRICG